MANMQVHITQILPIINVGIREYTIEELIALIFEELNLIALEWQILVWQSAMLSGNWSHAIDLRLSSTESEKTFCALHVAH